MSAQVPVLQLRKLLPPNSPLDGVVDLVDTEGLLADGSDDQIAWVDSQRTDTYPQSGSRTRPFKTFPQAFATGKPNIFLLGSGESLGAGDGAPFPIDFNSHPQGLRVVGLTKTLSLGRPYSMTFNGVGGFILGGASANAVGVWFEDLRIKAASGKTAILLDNTNRGARLFVKDCHVLGGSKSIHARQSAASPSGSSEHQILVFGSNPELCKIGFGMVMEWDAAVPQSQIPRFINTEIQGVEPQNVALVRDMFFEDCRFFPFSFCDGNALQTIHCVNCIRESAEILPYTREDLALCSASAPAVSPGGYNFETLTVSAAQSEVVVFEDFAVAALLNPSGLKMDVAGLGSTVSFDPSDIVSESFGTLTDFFSIFSSAPVFVTNAGKRGIGFTIDPSAIIAANIATIRWTWNGRPFELEVTVTA